MKRVHFAVLLVLATPMSMAQRPKPATAGQYRAWRAEIRKALYIPVSLPAPAPESLGRFEPMPGVVAERVTYATQFGMRVPAIVYAPAKPMAKRLPGLVIVNGHGGDKYSWYAFYSGLLYAQAGGVVVTYDPVGEGERNAEHKSRTGAHDQQIDGPHTGARMGGQMVLDVMEAVSYLRGRGDVDGARIAVAGYSMGSFIATIAGAVDPRIHALILSGGGDLDGVGGYWDSSTKLMCQARPYQALRFLGDRAAVLFALNEQRGPTYIMNGTADTVVDIPHHLEPFFADLRMRVEAITGTKKDIFETYFVPDVSHRPSWVTRPAAIWMQAKLGFPGWTSSSLAAMPETHVSEWAAANGVDIDRGSLREEREGGIRELGRGYPNIPRADLDALPLAQWQQRKAEFVYETWVERALAADGLTGAEAKAAVARK